MTKHNGGNAVKAGFYWNLKKWEMVPLSGTGGILPGSAEDRYLKVPIVAFLFVAPVMGGLYAFFLPFIGFAMLFAFLARKVGVGGRLAADRVGGLVGPDWQPGESYMAGKRGKKAEKSAEEGKKDSDNDARA